jgi:L-rhamnose mutarotase
MERVAFKMKLHKGCEEEYKRRHDQLWPELEELLKKTGISEYSIIPGPGNKLVIRYFKAEDQLL